MAMQGLEANFGGFIFSALFVIVGALAIKYPKSFARVLWCYLDLEKMKGDYASFAKTGGKIFIVWGFILAVYGAVVTLLGESNDLLQLLLIICLLTTVAYLAREMIRKKAHPILG